MARAPRSDADGASVWEVWRSWLEMADESMWAAATAEDVGCRRPAISRYYYAAYQAVSAVLLYRNIPRPTIDRVEREAWSHDLTPDLVRDHFVPVCRSRDRRNDLAHRLGTLYKMRLIADYVSSAALTESNLADARRSAGILVHFATTVLPKGTSRSGEGTT